MEGVTLENQFDMEDTNMKIAVVSDIHGNKQALEAVLADIAGYKPHHIVCLGDVVGYGGDPEWCVQTVKAVCSVCILGNHDVVVAEIQQLHGLNPMALYALSWTMDNISEDSLAFLRSLSYVAQGHGNKIGYVHSSFPHPQGFGYLFRWERIQEHFEAQKHKIVFLGHSHVPDCWTTDGKKVFGTFGFRNNFVEFDLEGPHSDKSFINVGSVGQPRDGDSRASYALVEKEGSRLLIHNKRVEYNIESAQKRIRECGLPENLADRLERGK